MSQAPWAELGQHGVRRVLYQTEPVHHCAGRRVGRYAVDELWDFSHHNLEACKAASDAPRVLRYVPPGAVEPAPPPEPVTASDGAAVLFFFGNPKEAQRQLCYRLLRQLLGQQRVEHTFSAFSEAKWRAKVLARAHCFVNLHKECGSPHNPVTFRVPKLLNAGRLVLSERAHPEDEREWRGIVPFYDNMTALAAAFERLVETGEHVARAREASARFRRRFAPRRVFERAGIFGELLLASPTV